MRLFECTTMLFEAEWLGDTKSGGTRNIDGRNIGHRPLLALFIQFADGGVVGI